MNVIVSLMAAGAKKNFSKEEFRRIRKEADAHYRRLVSKNLKWARTGTIGKGASCCDFRIIDISRCPDYKD